MAKKEQKNKNFTTKKKKETIQAIKLYNQLTTSWILAPTWLPYDTRDPTLCPECDRVCVCLEWYCVQLQQDRTSVGCSQARSERERERD